MCRQSFFSETLPHDRFMMTVFSLLFEEGRIRGYWRGRRIFNFISAPLFAHGCFWIGCRPIKTLRIFPVCLSSWMSFRLRTFVVSFSVEAAGFGVLTRIAASLRRQGCQRRMRQIGWWVRSLYLSNLSQLLRHKLGYDLIGRDCGIRRQINGYIWQRGFRRFSAG
jgi:hypothetical protein